MGGFAAVPMDVPVVLSREEARRLAEQELAKAKYGGTPDWVVNALHRVNALIQQLLDLLDSVGGGNRGFSPVVVVIALLLLVAVVVIVWRVGLPRLRHRSRTEEVQVDSARSPASYRDHADQLAAAGDYRAAIGDRFRAVVRTLEERTILDARPARTASEVASSAALHLPAGREPLGALAAVFNDAWYGDRPATQQSYQRICDLDEQISLAADRVDLSAATDDDATVGAGPGRRR